MFTNGFWGPSGTLYFENGSKKYQGEFVKGKAHGNGRLYTIDDKLIYEGDFYYGEFHGNGISYADNEKKSFEGNFRRGKKSGKGKLFNTEGDLEFEGHFFAGEIEGKGIKYSKDGDKTITVDLFYRAGKVVENLDDFIEKGGAKVLFANLFTTKGGLGSLASLTSIPSPTRK